MQSAREQMISEYTAALATARERIEELEQQLAERDGMVAEYREALGRARVRVDELTGVRAVDIPVLFTPDPRLPESVRLGDVEIRILEEALEHGILGCWNERKGEITIHPDQPYPGKHIILVHELLHVAETVCLQNGVIKRRMPESFITNAAPVLLILLVSAGLYRGLTAAELDEVVSVVGR